MAARRIKGMALSVGVSVLIALAPAAASADLVDGLAAYDQGNYQAALAEWTPLAEDGDATAQALLGLLYRGVPGLPADAAVSARWYEAAAEQGHAHAQYNIGLAYLSGYGVQQDDVTAFMWLDIAARGIPVGPDGTNSASKRRDTLAARMSAAEIAEATRRAEDWQPVFYSR